MSRQLIPGAFSLPAGEAPSPRTATINNDGDPMTDDATSPSSPVGDDSPTQSRAYGWMLGSKDNYAVDREFIRQTLQLVPEGVDIARQNRLFLYRAVRYLTTEVGITQFLDLGSGYPTNNNVHQVAQQFQPDASVVYVDIDPIVLVHGQALLADNPNTTVITADMTKPEQILDHPDTQRLIDFDKPVAVLMLSIPHCIPDDTDAQRAILGPMERAASGSHLALTHVVADTQTQAAELTETITEQGMPWKTRTPALIDEWFQDLQRLEPGLCDIAHWRPDPTQPPLDDVPAELAPYTGLSLKEKRIYEYGGVLSKP